MTTISGATKLVGIIGWPVEHSLSPRMHNAAFAALGLDWAYVPLPTPPERVDEAIRGLAALGFVGANVTAPHKHAAAALCDTDAPSVNTLIVRDDRVEGVSTDAAILSGLAGRARDRPGRRWLRDRVHACTPGRAAVRTAWELAARLQREPTLVVNATSERDAVLVELTEDQTLVDLPYPETATALAARRAGATVISGLEVLVAQGAASFELWTGVAAPVEVMRDAVGLPA